MALLVRCLSAVLSATALLALPAFAAETPAGSWEGLVTEVDDGTYVVAVTIEDDGTTGSVDYRRGVCGGTLGLVEERGGHFLYDERLNFGRDRCVDRLQVRLTPGPGDSLYFEELLEGRPVVYGRLHRVGGGPLGCAAAGRELLDDLETCLSFPAGRAECLLGATGKYRESTGRGPGRCGGTCGAILRECVVEECADGDPACVRGCIGGVTRSPCRE